jgi:hypothetical protein
MDANVQHFVSFLEKDITEWEDAANFYERYISSVADLPEQRVHSGKEEADRFRARIKVRKELIETLLSGK